MKIDTAKGRSWAYIFGQSEVFTGPVFSEKLEEQWRESCDEGHLHLINLTPDQC